MKYGRFVGTTLLGLLAIPSLLLLLLCVVAVYPLHLSGALFLDLLEDFRTWRRS